MFTRVLLFGLLLCATVAPAAELISTNSLWRFARGTNEASSPDITAWRSEAFVDSAFTDGPSPFWYGDVRPGGTQLGDMLNNYTCLFLRRTFVVSNLASFCALRLDYFIDDGFVAWINGREVLRINVDAGEVTYNTVALNQPVDPAPFVNSTIPSAASFLHEGTNVITIQVFNTSAGSSDLGFDCALSTLTGETVAPTIATVSPLPGNLSSLTAVTVTFSEPVTGVTFDDFLINTQPATSVSGSGTTYTFTFPQPNYGNVSISWFPTNEIRDTSLCGNPFNGSGPGANWAYTLADTVAPTVANLFPQAGSSVHNLSQVEVTFSEEVTGVNAGDLLINNQAATMVTRLPGGPYIFQFPEQPAGPVNLQWAGGHGIADQAAPANLFVGGPWSYVVDPNAAVGDLVINEFLASNQNGLQDEDFEQQDWIEIYNRGSTAVDLSGWSLSDDADLPGLWVFPSRLLGPGQYLVLFASGKDRKNPAGANRLHTNFQLGEDGEFLGLYNADSPRVLLSGFGSRYPTQRSNYSYGRDSQGQLRYYATPTPGAANGNSSITGVAEPVHFSASRGFYTQGFDLILTCPTPGVTIGYTTDSTEPTLVNRRLYGGPLRLTSTTMLRAVAFRNNLLPSRAVTHSYLFNLTPAQRSLPVVNIVTATNNMNGRTGIIGMSGGSRAGDGLYITNNPATDYHNPSAHGIAWERPVSAEYILPDNSGFQIDCGIRVQGSDWQRPRTLPGSKFSFRLYFRGDYGSGRLEYPLFPLSPIQSFDQLVLRAGFNEQGNPFIRDEITRRLSHDMGQVASHGGFYNLFTNGAYAGYYNPCERVHEEMLQSQLGGGSQWDVVAPDFAQSAEFPGVVDGDRNDFRNMLNYVWTQQNSTTMLNPAIYTEVGRRLDLANFADYCLLNAYVAMGDWPANNWRAGRERSTNGIWRFIVWDAEWAMGIYALAVTRDSFGFSGTGTEDAGLNSTGNSEIARLYQRLRVNREFRLLCADRIQKHFFHGGALTGLNISNRFDQMRTELAAVVPGMDTEILLWARDRLPIIMAQFNTYGLYGYSNALYGVFASSNAPAFNQHGGRVAPGFNLTMSAPLGGTLYYTTNGHDPRVPFSGAVSNAATAYAGPILLTRSLPIKARTLLNGTNWSALSSVTFEVGTLGVPLRVTEIMYNPPGGFLHEFIELENIGGSAVDLGGMYFDEAINFTFNLGSSLAPGARLVLANNTDPASFAAAYPGVAVFGYFSGNLNNTGERLTLHRANGEIVLTVDYADSAGWPTAADGGGASLELVDLQGGADDPANWRASTQPGGTPGAVSAPPSAPRVMLNEVMAQNGAAVSNGGTYPDWIELYNPGPTSTNLAGWSLSDDNNVRKFVFPSINLPANGYLVVWCDATTNTTPGLHTGFTLDAGGHQVFLYGPGPGTNRIDGVSLGLQLANYSVGRVGEAWALTTPTPNATNSAAPVAAQSSLSINEWLANSPPGQSDWLELFNTAPLPVSLRGAYLGTADNVQPITSLSFVAPFGFAQFFADEGVGPAHLDFRLPAAGGSIILSDATATEVNRVSYTNAVEGLTRGRIPDGSGSFANFTGTASPGATNYVSTYVGPILNEVLARNRSAVTHAGRVADFIELFNPGSPFNLSGMSLSVGSPTPGEWIFPAGTMISDYLVIWCDDGQPVSMTPGNFNIGRALDGESGGIYLFNPAGQLVNSVEYGFQVADQSIGISGGQWRLQSAPTPSALNGAPAALGVSGVLRLNEWMAQPSAGADWFELFNPTNLPVALSGITLTDDPSLAGQTNFRAAPLSFIGPQAYVKWTADSQAGDGRDHVNFSLSAQGDTLRIYSTNGANFVLIDSVTFGAQQIGVSQGRLPDGATNSQVGFPGSATPAEANYQLVPDLVINEILTHTDPPLEDAVEVRNTGTNTVNLGGWYLSNSQDNFKKYRIPNDTMLASGGYRVFYANQFDDGSPNAFTFNSAHGDEAWLSAADGAGNLTGFRTGAKFGPAANGVSFGRHATRVGVDYTAMSALSFGTSVTAQDPPAMLAVFRTGTGAANAAPLIGPIIINELMYHPLPGPNSDEEDEYIELKNISGATVQLFDPAHATNTWRLTGGIQFAFPQGVTLGAGEYLLLVNFDPANLVALAAFRSRYGIAANVPVRGPYAGKLANDADEVNLRKPDAPQPAGASDAGFVPYVLVDKVAYADAVPWPDGAVDGGGLSLQRLATAPYGNDPLNWVASAPTPGGGNGSGVVTRPVITSSPQGTNVLEGATARFTVAASGPGPLQYQWRFNGTQLPDATNAALVLDYALLEDEGSYDAIVSNPGGAAISEAARLVVRVGPTVLTGPGSLTVRPGTNIVFTVTARGAAPLSYQWRLNGVNLPGENNPTLVRNNVQLADDGVYDVIVSNPYAMTIASGQLRVLVSPTIIQAPVAQTVPAGSRVYLSVAITGSPPPFGYQWRSNSFVFPVIVSSERTNFFSIRTATNAVTATYRVVVTNEASPGNTVVASFAITTVADTDFDGLSDALEISLGLNPNDPSDAAGDLDDDGMSNRAEFIAGTEPTNALSYLKVDLSALPGPPTVILNAVSNKTYTVQFSDHLGLGLWQRLANVLARPTNRVETVVDPAWTTNRFYRLATPWQP